MVECKKRARDFEYHLFLSNSLGTLVNKDSETSGTYTDPTGGPLFLFSLCFAWEVQRIFFQSHKDCAAPPKEENLTITLQRSKPALFRLK